MKPRHKRIAAIAIGVVALGVVTALVLRAFNENLVFFFTPTEVAANKAPQGRTFRIGGMVEKGSVKRDGVDVRFMVTDTAKTLPVTYRGALPDLFREGKGVVAQGHLLLLAAMLVGAAALAPWAIAAAVRISIE